MLVWCWSSSTTWNISTWYSITYESNLSINADIGCECRRISGKRSSCFLLKSFREQSNGQWSDDRWKPIFTYGENHNELFDIIDLRSIERISLRYFLFNQTSTSQFTFHGYYLLCHCGSTFNQRLFGISQQTYWISISNNCFSFECLYWSDFIVFCKNAFLLRFEWIYSLLRLLSGYFWHTIRRLLCQTIRYERTTMCQILLYHSCSFICDLPWIDSTLSWTDNW